MTTASSLNSIDFRYRKLTESRQADRSSSGQGTLEHTQLVFSDFSVTIDAAFRLTADGDFFNILFVDEEDQPVQMAVEVYSTDTRLLAQVILARQSSAVAAFTKSQLVESGQLESYRDSTCPFCDGTNLLINLPETPQVYCRNCDSLYSRDQSGLGDIERHFRVCEGCEMYARPRPFAIFYFYFLGFTFGFHHDNVVRCSGCMRGSAWKMVLGNVFGLIALPFAFLQLYRAYATKNLTGVFEGLDSANLRARRGQIDQALTQYDAILDRVPVNAGVKFNIATGLVLKRDFPHAEAMFEMALDDCANYWPALQGLLGCLHEQNKQAKISAVLEIWDLSQVR